MSDLPRPSLQLVEPEQKKPELPLRDPREPGIFDSVARQIYERDYPDDAKRIAEGVKDDG